MSELPKPNCFCPHCGFDNASAHNEAHQLECGSILAGTYLVGCVLGQGGFGITYVGWDLNLDIKVAIKEYYPEGCVTRDTHTHVSVLTLAGNKEIDFQKGKERFVNEAKALARFAGDGCIVGVRSFFYENGTAYIVMDYIDGETLKSYVTRRGGKLTAAETLNLLRPLCDSLARVHEAGLLHRDISPDNIMLRPDGTLALLDFGAARQMSVAGERSNTINVKHGFAPEEQYRTRGEQGPWTDVYALCATIYRLTTGVAPPQALDRLANQALLAPPNQHGADFTPAQERAILHGLAVRTADRTQSMPQFIEELYGGRQSTFQPRSVKTQPISPAPTTGVVPPAGPATPAAFEAGGAPKKNRGKKPWLIAGLAAASLILVLLILFARNSAKKAQPVSASSSSATTNAAAQAGAAILSDSQTDALAATPDATPTVAPVTPDAVTITLGFGESYRCSAGDFDLPYNIDNDDVSWVCSSSNQGVTCSRGGYIEAGNVQFDPSQEYNDPVSVVGTTSNGSVLTYKVRVGDGQTYAFDWSDSARSMKAVQGYTYIATPEIKNCLGFTLTFEYELSEGTIHNDSWSFWVRENGTDWVYICDILITEGVEHTEDIVFDRPITFSEIILQPQKQYDYFSYSHYYGVDHLVFDLGA